EKLLPAAVQMRKGVLELPLIVRVVNRDALPAGLAECKNRHSLVVTGEAVPLVGRTGRRTFEQRDRPLEGGLQPFGRRPAAPALREGDRDGNKQHQSQHGRSSPGSAEGPPNGMPECRELVPAIQSA